MKYIFGACAAAVLAIASPAVADVKPAKQLNVTYTVTSEVKADCSLNGGKAAGETKSVLPRAGAKVAFTSSFKCNVQQTAAPVSITPKNGVLKSVTTGVDATLPYYVSLNFVQGSTQQLIAETEVKGTTAISGANLVLNKQKEGDPSGWGNLTLTVKVKEDAKWAAKYSESLTLTVG